ncbi:MAG: hypothetical protein AB7L84_16615 [Acidimicrobiia bacterium]
MAGGASEDHDPDELVELVTTRLADGPMLLAALRRQGLPAQGIETFDPVGETLGLMRIMVRRADAPAAQQLLSGRPARTRRPRA